MFNADNIDDRNIVEILSRHNATVSLFTTNKELERLNLNKGHSVKGARRIYLSPVLSIECSMVDIQKFAKNGYRLAVKRFVNVMERQFNRGLLTNFYNNLQTLEIGRGKFGIRNFFTKRNTVGTYNAKENRIKIDRKYENSIYHELMHMSSSKYINGIYYSGFKQYSEFDDLGSFGRGLNEGYTQFMIEKYFLDSNGFSYVYETRMAQHIEEIVGRYRMEDLYLNADLNGLVKSLQMYATEKDILDFIANMDLFSDYVNNKKYRKEKKKEISLLFEKINVFIYGTYINKMKGLYSSGMYSFNDITKELVNFRNSLMVGLKIDTIGVDERRINSLLNGMCADALCECEQINKGRKR